MLVLDTPPFDPLPKAEPHGNSLYCWIAVHADGSEGVLSHTMPSGLTMPLVTAQKWLAEGRLAAMARAVAANPVLL